MEALKSAVLLDIENLVIAAKDDWSLKLSVKDIVQILVNYIKTEAVPYGESKYLFAAISLPLVPGENEPQGWHRTRKEVSTITHILADNGFQVMTVSSSENAADNILKKVFARIIAQDPEVGSVLLCSGDGRDPFPEIMSMLKESGKQVCAVGYNQIPEGLRNSDHTVTLAHNIHLDLGRGIRFSDIALQELPSAKKIGDDAPKAPSLADIYRDVVKEIKNGKSSSHPVYRERLIRAVSVLEKHFLHHRTSSTFRLIQVLKNEFWNVSSEELRQLFFALVDYTDLFFDIPYYGVDDSSKDRAKLQIKS